jgi:membrane-associated tyrosine- and threonine-specific cdc2-inhibitory kinase
LSIASSATKNYSGWCDDQNLALPKIALTPSRQTSLESAPHEFQLQFQLDAAQCSPIPGIPEEEGDSSSKSDCFARKTKLQLSTSNESTTTTSSSAGRPMPDLAAFDGNANNDSSRSSSSTHSGYDDKPPSPKLFCPPTPVRIHPVFRGTTRQKFSRSNSLIANKVLATCSPQVFGGRTVAAVDSFILDECKYEHANGTGSAVPPRSVDHDDWLLHTRPLLLRNIDNREMVQEAEGKPSQSVSMATTFEVISKLGSGAFADVYKVKSKVDGRLYAVKRNRRQFRGRRDRDAVLSEVRSMQRIQGQAALLSKGGNGNVDNSLYLLSFYQAWQEDGHFFCQTELCCRDTCREMMDALRSEWNVAKTLYPCLLRLPTLNGVVAGSASDVEGRLIPEPVIWKVCHDIAGGLSFLHSRRVGLVHNDIKPSNMFLVKHDKLGALCKIGDFGMARSIGSSEDGQEGDQKYMSLEMLQSGTSLPSSDIFSLGLTLYEMASNLSFVVPADGSRWHELRQRPHALDFPSERSSELASLIRCMLDPESEKRPMTECILRIRSVAEAGRLESSFLRSYIRDAEAREQREEERYISQHDTQTPRNAPRALCSPPLTKQLLAPPL